MTDPIEKKSSMKRVESMVQPLPTQKRVMSGGVRRSQTASWNEELTEGWRFIDSSETLEHRVLRYNSYLNPTDMQLNAMTSKIQDHLKSMSQDKENDLLHRVAHIEFEKKGTAYAVDLGSKTIVAVCIRKDGDDVHVEEASTPLIDAKRNLASPDTTAFELFDEIAKTVAKLPTPVDSGSSGHVPIAFVCSFDVHNRSKTSMYLRKWSKGMQTGRNTDDTVEGSDLAAMLDCALRRNGLNFRVHCAMHDLVTAGILGVTQHSNDPEYSVRFIMNLGTGFNVGAILSQGRPEFQGDVADMRVNQYNVSIPKADFDLEVDWAEGNIDENPVEKLVAGKYLGEVARRVIIKIFNINAPKLAWSREALPTDAAVRIATDESSDLSVVRQILFILWGWEITTEEAEHVKSICNSVFNRSASMVAACLCAVARANNGLIPALGGSIVAVSGGLYNSNAFYRNLVRGKIDSILGPILSRLLKLEPVHGGSAVGAALTLLQKPK